MKRKEKFIFFNNTIPATVFLFCLLLVVCSVCLATVALQIFAQLQNFLALPIFATCEFSQAANFHKDTKFLDRAFCCRN